MKMSNTHIGLALMFCAMVAVAGLYHFGAPPEIVSSGLGSYAAMAVVQSAYGERMAAAVAGMIATENEYDVDTCQVETAAGISFGVAVGQGTADNGIVVGGSTAAKFRGISVRDITLVNATVDKYAQYQNAGVLTRGVIWVTVGGDVVAGGDVTFATATGVLSSIAADGSNFAIAGARWMSTALSGGLAKVRLGGALPSA